MSGRLVQADRAATLGLLAAMVVSAERNLFTFTPPWGAYVFAGSASVATGGKPFPLGRPVIT